MNLVTKVIRGLLAVALVATITSTAVTLASAQPTEVWVDDDWAGSSPGDLVDGHIFGTDAFNKIQDGIDAVASPGTVHVAAGNYVENITLKDAVQVLGAGADVTTIDGGGSSSVVTAIGVGSGTALNGFTITHGLGGPFTGGGGLYIAGGSSMVVSDNIVRDNRSAVSGGGLLIDSSSPTIVYNIINANIADGNGGGIYMESSSAFIGNNTISSNSGWGASGVFVYQSSPTIARNTIVEHTGVVGAIMVYESSGLIINNVIALNATTYAAGIRVVYESSSPIIANNSILQNSTLSGGAISCEYHPSPVIVNNILWDNDGDDLSGEGCTAIYSDIEDGDPGEGNISADPMFIDPAGGDYRLQADSPCIDAGTNEGAPTVDIEGNLRPVDGDGDDTATTDMGAYEYVRPATSVYVDIKPGSCPKPLNLKSKGVLPVAVLGTRDFDVTKIDPETILLSREDGVGDNAAAIRWSYEDVATPFEGELCDCTTDGSDGFDDLTLKFDTQEVVSALGDVNDGDELVLTLTGRLYDGTPIEGKDCVWILKKGGGKGKGKK